MSEVRIRWTQRAAGRHIGDIETLERTPWVDAVLAAGRAVVVSEDAPIEVPVEAPVEEAPRPRRPRPAAPEETGDGDPQAE